MTISKPIAIVSGLIIATTMAFASASSVSATSHGSQDCVDGSKYSNLTYNWNAADKITVQTKGDKKLCNDVTVYLSSYTMPDNYDGKGFSASNKTAWPQQVFASKAATLKKGTNGQTTLTVALPEVCKNIQVDLYYAPEIKVVGKEGHGGQYISGKIYTKTKPTCTPVTPPVTPEEPPVTPEPPVIPPVVPKEEAQTPPQVVPTPTVLPATGAGDVVISAVVVTGLTYAGIAFLRKRP